MEERERLSDQTLVEQAQQGNSDALGQLVLKYQGPVLRDLLKRTPDLPRAQDALGDAFLKVVQEIGSLRDGQRFLRWFSQIAQNCLFDAYRSSQRHPSFSLDSLEERLGNPELSIFGVGERDLSHYARAIIDQRQNPESVVLRQERIEIIFHAVQALPPNQETVIVLNYFAGLDHGEIAKKMGCCPQNVHNLAWQARDRLRTTLPEL